MKLRYLFVLLAIATVIGFYSCEKDDDEPPASNSISRLYISYSDFNENPDLTQFNNVVLLPNSDDEENMGLRATPFLSNVKGGNTIYFNPSARLIFQSSINTTVTDTFVYKLNIGETGALSNDNNRIRQGLLRDVRGLVFHPSLDKLYAISNGGGTPAYYVFDRPRGLSEFRKPGQTYHFKNEIVPWDVTIVKSGLVVSKSGTNGGVEIYDNLVISRDSIVQSVEPSKVLTVSDAVNIRGMSVDTVNNMLALTDFVQTGTGASATYEGRILIFDDYAKISAATGAISPTRIIKGVNTKLKQPVDVELDFRKDSKYIYVADPISKAVYRFLKTDNGDVAPNATYQYQQPGRAEASIPRGISLDARN